VTPTTRTWPLTSGAFHTEQTGVLRLAGEFRFQHFAQSVIPPTMAVLDALTAVILNSNIFRNVTSRIMVTFEDVSEKFTASICKTEMATEQLA
jgi:hypothetical protein